MEEVASVVEEGHVMVIMLVVEEAGLFEEKELQADCPITPQMLLWPVHAFLLGICPPMILGSPKNSWKSALLVMVRFWVCPF